MKLEPELIKDILVWGENNLPNDDKIFSASGLEFKGFSKQQILFHTKLLYKNEYLEGDVATNISSDFFDFDFDSLTMKGYELLEMMKNDTVWKKIQSKLAEIGMQAIPALIPLALEQVKILLAK